MTPKQEAFVREYLIDLNATAAYKRAGYAAKGHAAEANAERLLRKAEVREAVSKAQQSRAERVQVDADWVLSRLHAELTADLSDLYDENGCLKQVHDWPKVWRTGLVAGVETTQERDGSDAEGKPVYATVRKVKLADRVRMLELVGKHIGVGAFRERLEHTGKDGGPLELKSATDEQLDARIAALMAKTHGNAG